MCGRGDDKSSLLIWADLEIPWRLMMHNDWICLGTCFLRCLNKEGISTQNVGGTILQAGAPDWMEKGESQQNAVIFLLFASWPIMISTALLYPVHHCGRNPLKPWAKINPVGFCEAFNYSNEESEVRKGGYQFVVS